MRKTYVDDYMMDDQRTIDMLEEIKEMTDEEFEDHIRKLKREEAQKEVQVS